MLRLLSFSLLHLCLVLKKCEGKRNFAFEEIEILNVFQRAYLPSHFLLPFPRRQSKGRFSKNFWVMSAVCFSIAGNLCFLISVEPFDKDLPFLPYLQNSFDEFQGPINLGFGFIFALAHALLVVFMQLFIKFYTVSVWIFSPFGIEKWKCFITFVLVVFTIWHPFLVNYTPSCLRLRVLLWFCCSFQEKHKFQA